MGWRDDPVVENKPAWMGDPEVPRTRPGGLSLTPFNAPDTEGMGYKFGGAITDTLAGHVPPEIAGGAGYLGNVALQAAATLIGGKLGSQAGNTLKNLGQSTMRMAIKPSPTLGPAKTAEAVKTMLTADVGNLLPGANVTPGGIAQLQSRIGTLGNEVNQLGAASPEVINKYKIAKALRDIEARYGPANSAAPLSDLKSINNLKSEFLATHRNMSVEDALNLKSGIYKNLGEKAYKGTELKTAEVAGQKALAKSLRSATESAVPEIAPKNAEQSQLINALKAVINRNAIAGNKDPISLGFLASHPSAGAAFLGNRSELVKSILARLLYSGGKPLGTAVGAGIAADYGMEQGNQ